MGFFKKPCTHYNSRTEFVDLHTGADGEIYVRSQKKCPDCNFRTVHAARLPEWVAVAIDRGKLDWNKNTGTF
jgi:hypothetical protein